MYDYLYGKLVELTPSYAVVETSGVGYNVEISLNTYTSLSGIEMCKIYTHLVVREDAHLLHGFFTKSERQIFRLLISVSGIGPNTARVMLSSLTPGEIKNAILTDNVHLLKSVKGIGIKTAERTIIELRDKMEKAEITDEIFSTQNNTVKNEALSALVMLGFPKKNAETVLDKILNETPDLQVEHAVKQALKRM
jgi:Holliday junction DNA helicase RuvA